MDNLLPTELLEEFGSYFKKVQAKSILNIDQSLKKPLDFQVQLLEDAVKIFGGSIPPNRFSHYYIAIVTNGQAIKTIGTTEFRIIPNTLIFIPSGTIHSSHSFTPDTKGFIISFSIAYLLTNHSNKSYLNELAFFQNDNQHYLYLTEHESEVLLNCFENILAEYLNYQENKNDLLKLYMLELLLKADRIYKKHISPMINKTNTQSKIVNEFKGLLDKYFLQEKSVAFYAEQLAIHPNYLNATIKSTIGKTCSEMIHERIILEAKCLLISTQLSIKEIAAYLSFEDSSYFSKYFKKLTNESPIYYREKYNH